MGDRPGSSSGGEVGEVVVTVDRREKNLQKYSGTASAFSGEQLGSVGIREFVNIKSVVVHETAPTNHPTSE